MALEQQENKETEIAYLVSPLHGLPFLVSHLLHLLASGLHKMATRWHTMSGCIPECTVTVIMWNESRAQLKVFMDS